SLYLDRAHADLVEPRHVVGVGAAEYRTDHGAGIERFALDRNGEVALVDPLPGNGEFVGGAEHDDRQLDHFRLVVVIECQCSLDCEVGAGKHNVVELQPAIRVRRQIERYGGLRLRSVAPSDRLESQLRFGQVRPDVKV